MKNPYQIALTVVTVLLFVVAGILYAVGSAQTGDYGQSEPLKQLPYVVAGNTWLSFGALSLLLTLLLGGVGWLAESMRIRAIVSDAATERAVED